MDVREVRGGSVPTEEDVDLERFFGLSLDLLCTLGTDGYFRRVNPAFERVLGYSGSELAAMHLLDLVHPQDREVTAREIERLKAGVPALLLENRCRARSGEYRWLAWTAIPEAGTGIVYAVARDVTERNHLDDHLRQSHKMEAVGRLAGGIAHDFSNLLTVMLGYSESLARCFTDSDPARQELAEIRLAAERATQLTRQLLAFSRRQVLHPKVLDLNWVVATTERMLHRLVGDDVRLQTTLSAGLGAVRVDRGQIEQVLMNLVMNARDAMPRGGTLTIETRNVVLPDPAVARGPMPAGSYVMLTVSDTGTGMDAATLEHVFEPFFSTKGSKGTGLGLATAFGIVKQSGGEIWVESEPGRGSTFRICLPLVEEPADAAAPEEDGSAHGRETILVVEDEDAVRALVTGILRHQGYKVLGASNPEEAMAVAEGTPEPIDLLVTDMVMPRMNGPELAQQMALVRPRLRMLYISGYTDHALLRNHMLSPEMCFLQKPFTPAALGRKVREVLDAVVV